jgi:hypothetical protein
MANKEVAPYLYAVKPDTHVLVQLHLGTANGGTKWRFTAVNTYNVHIPKDEKVWSVRCQMWTS